MNMAKRPAAGEIVDEALRHFLAAHPPAGKRICVAFSGGMDSVALLHALHRYRQAAGGEAAFALSAMHVHHGLSPRADAWSAFCADMCAGMGIALETVHVDVPRASGEGLEAAARRCRYRAFAGVDADWLALAHHRDDQSETVLLNLLRGAGVAGAAGMPAMRVQGEALREAGRNAMLVRPLLEAPRAAIEAYAVEHGLRWVDDESNGDRRFRRNFLRHDILPALETSFPGARGALARAAGHFAEAADLLGQLAELDAATVRRPSGRLGLAAYNALPPARARNLLRHAWAAAGFRMPEARWLEEARRQLATADAESETCIATPDGELRVYRGELYCLPRGASGAAKVSAVPSPALWRGEPELRWGAGCVRFARVLGRGIAARWLEGVGKDGCVQAILRARQGGERFRPQANRPRRALRTLLQEAGAPPWERARMPLLWLKRRGGLDGMPEGGESARLVWVGGLGVDAGFACAPDEPGVLPVWLP